MLIVCVNKLNKTKLIRDDIQRIRILSEANFPGHIFYSLSPDKLSTGLTCLVPLQIDSIFVVIRIKQNKIMFIIHYKIISIFENTFEREGEKREILYYNRRQIFNQQYRFNLQKLKGKPNPRFKNNRVWKWNNT